MMSKTIVKCIVTGYEKPFNKTSLQKKIDKFGSIDMFHRFYVSKEAAKLLKKGSSIEEARRTLKSNASHQVDIEVLYKLKLFKKNKRKNTLSSEERKNLKEATERNETKARNRITLMWFNSGNLPHSGQENIFTAYFHSFLMERVHS